MHPSSDVSSWSPPFIPPDDPAIKTLFLVNGKTTSRQQIQLLLFVNAPCFCAFGQSNLFSFAEAHLDKRGRQGGVMLTVSGMTNDREVGEDRVIGL
jgi:hypothetical protein